ncbi:hypothetical protein AB0D14_23120 [Streptomyces sp. NPDC048484]|uniref:hypothetical protein n=1 Tax=Streptomyces sp. NPDC048484 TaxID=3155146 RepID=UPI0034123290
MRPAQCGGTAHHGLVLAAAGLAVLLAATVLAALAALTEKAVEGGIQRRLARDLHHSRRSPRDAAARRS